MKLKDDFNEKKTLQTIIDENVKKDLKVER
jgi:hypothetical protein